jgi:DNA polymerase III delta prime subunit
MLHNDYLWTEKYRPHKIEDVVLPPKLKETFQSYVDTGNVPTLILTGPPGVGKTTVAMAMLDELGCEYLKLNGSLEGRQIDMLRGKITDFASTVSFEGGRKYVILDEADYANPQTVQPALRGFIEDFADNCGFIFTCNYKSKIIPAISNSRCAEIEFNFTKAETKAMVPEFFRKSVKVLKAENVEYDKVVVGTLIKKFAPDWRKILNELQKYGQSGHIDAGILVSLKEVQLDELCKMLKGKEFNSVRTWVAENGYADPSDLFGALYKHADKYLKKTSSPVLIQLMAKYQYQSAFSANQEINTMAFFVEIMMEAEWL